MKKTNKGVRGLAYCLLVSLILSLLPLSAAAVSATDFEDITTEHWAYEYVEDVTSHGWFLGTSASTFSPDSLMTRGMFVTALARYANATLDNNAETAFTDVPAGQYYTGAVAWGVSRGLISGQLDSVFGTHDPITREDMVLIVIRMVDYLEINLPYDVEWKDFTDTALISDYAESALSRSIRSGIILGYEDGSVRPQGASTRAEVAAVLSRIRDMIGEINDADTPTTAYYTVTFDPQNGKDVTEVSVVSGAVVAKPSNPIRSGYSFRGWYTAESGGKKYDFTEKVTENLTLYGQWSKTSSGGSSGGSSGSGGDNSGGGTSTEETATIIYHANGAAGEDYTDTVTVNTAYTIKSLEEAGFTAPAGYALSKWCTTADMSSGIFYEVGANITFTQSETIELYASWDYVGVYYTVTYDANSGQGGTAAAGIIPGSGHTVYSDTEAGVSLVDWAFISWNTSADGSGTSYQPGELLTVTDDITLYAQWDYVGGIYYTVTYDANSGQGGTAAAGIIPGSGHTVYSDSEAGVSRVDWAFHSRNTSADGSGTGYQPGEMLTVTGDITLYAQWDYVGGIYYTVTYDANGGQGGTAAAGIIPGSGHTVYSDTEAGVSLVDWALIGWNTSADGSGTSYQPGEMLTVTGDITLYAQWDYVGGIYYTVTYDANDGQGGTAVTGIIPGSRHTVYSDTEVGVSRVDWEFNSWNTSADGSGTSYQPGELLIVTGDITLYAQWDYAMVHYYSVTYLGFNGVGGGTEDYPSGTTYTIKDPIEMGIMVDPFTFQYWQDLNTGMMYYVGEQVVLAANMMLSPIAW